MVESCAAKSLEVLKWMGSITPPQNLVMVIGCLHKMPRLDILVEYPNFSYSGINGSLKLEMGPFSDCNNVSFNQTVDAIMLTQSIGSLRRLDLRGKRNWGSLPDQLQHLTSLEELWLRRFDIKALPEWFGNLSSLKTLELWRCNKLRHLPSKQAMQRLSKLTYLHIYECPLLLKEENSYSKYNPQIADSEWPSISHIPTVVVNRCDLKMPIIRIPIQ